MDKYIANRNILKATLEALHITIICDKVFKNRPSKICGRQLLKKLKGYGLL